MRLISNESLCLLSYETETPVIFTFQMDGRGDVRSTCSVREGWLEGLDMEALNAECKRIAQALEKMDFSTLTDDTQAQGSAKGGA